MEEPRRALEVNIKVILNDILKQLHLPAAEYGIYAVTDDELRAYVEIQSTTTKKTSTKFIGTPSKLIGQSQQNGARQAIKFLQETYNFDVADINYYPFRLVQHNYQKLLQNYKAIISEDVSK